MTPMTLPEIADVVGGTVVNAGRDVTVTGPAFVDSRVAERDGLFVAVVGERVDGHDYVDAAMAGGAAAVLSSQDTGQPGVVVADPVAALARLARHSLSRLPRVRVIALTGSQGKTTTKDVLAQVLAAAGTTVATYGSFNNELGLPLTVLRADTRTEYLLLEMGARHVGDLRASCEVAPPQVVGGAQRRQGAPGRVRLAGGDRARQGRDRGRAPGATGWRCSTPTTPWWPRWRRAPRPA